MISSKPLTVIVGVLLLPLDISAGYDTVDHEILLERRSSRFGIKGKALDWLQSHLTNRTQYVKVDDASSTVRPLYWGGMCLKGRS